MLWIPGTSKEAEKEKNSRVPLFQTSGPQTLTVEAQSSVVTPPKRGQHPSLQILGLCSLLSLPPESILAAQKSLLKGAIVERIAKRSQNRRNGTREPESPPAHTPGAGHTSVFSCVWEPLPSRGG